MFKSFTQNQITWRLTDPQPDKNAKGGKFFLKEGEKFLGKIGLKELHSLFSACLHFHLAFLNQFRKGKVAKYFTT